ncbi:hypothetical protein PPM_2616 [Paenibacillus polymyxa M1]|uniref:RNA-directed DNA polymerase n=1 Tax=Paenibacillus polymyxa TaxID=1406 RepID=UPI00021BBD2A|nr:RNA-directed DNA polymerase [Paenibacillus polymyxa]CCC85553.1 hypothetical protein PPM_2616 [Paenibacillus polymyxa M1]
MKISNILTKDVFLNAFEICKEYAKEDFILDINFRLLKDVLLETSREKMSQFYDDFISTDIILAVPEMFSTDIVSIPKGMTGVREYRFFSMYSMVLYNSIGLLFVECTDTNLRDLNFNQKYIYPFYPTKFHKDKDNWKASSDYKEGYSDFLSTLNQQLVVGDIVLRIDISKYFEEMQHKILIKIMQDYASPSLLTKYNLNGENNTITGLDFYFDSLMNKTQSIPQGRKNFVSDYLGYLYLVPFDVKVKELVKSNIMKFKSMVRYVDDIFIIFNKTEETIKNKEVFKELLSIEQRINSWLFDELQLTTNAAKTDRKIIKTSEERRGFLRFTRKTVSSPISKNKLNYQLIYFQNSLRKFKIKEAFSFLLTGEDRENLKVIFDPKFQNYLFQKENVDRTKLILNEITFDLTADYINILIALFFIRRKKKGGNKFTTHLIKFIKKDLNLSDRRHIHILFTALAQNIDKTEEVVIRKKIKADSEILRSNNYGKYLLSFFKIRKKAKREPNLLGQTVYERITEEYIVRKINNNKFFYDIENHYNNLINELIRSPFKDEEAIIQQLIYYANSILNQKWDLAFNYLNNFFHEFCKVQYELKDTDNLNSVINKTSHLLELNELMTIRKFYNYRNFNSISHPSQKGTPSIKISGKILTNYHHTILPIVLKIMKNRE